MEGLVFVVPLITENSIQRVQDSSDIVEVVESYGVKLKRSGSSFQAVCPFHNEKTPSFNVNPQMQIFKCFGCGVGGGVIKFVQLMERCEFPEAVERLAGRAGITLEYEAGRNGDSEKKTVNRDRKQALLWACRQAFEYFRAALGSEREGAVAREYLQSRGFRQETIDGWGLGWAPDSWDGLLNAYLRKVVALGGEHKTEEAKKVGLEAGIFRFSEEKERIYDAFRGRVIFPIFDLQERPIGFGARVLVEKPEAGGKYINTSETPLFMKRSLLFGLNFAAKEIGLSRTAIVVEGYTDTIMCHQYGIRNVVATLGTALTVEHIRLLKRYIHNDGKVVALFDNDNAGKKATMRAIELFMEEDVNLWVLSSLEVKDAGEFLPKFGEEKFREFLQSAKESFAFVVEQELGGRDFSNDLGGKTSAIEKIMELVNCCPNSLRRSIMRAKVAEVAGINEEMLPVPEGRSKQRYRSERDEDQHADRSRSKSLAGGKTSVPLIVDAPKQARMKAERRLLHYMFADREWCSEIVDRYPPDEWFEEAEHLCAILIRDEWFASEVDSIRIERLLEKTVREDVKELLLDFVDFSGSGAQRGASPGAGVGDETLNAGELHEILLRIRIEGLKERRQEISAEYAQAELAGAKETADRLLLEKLHLEKEIRGLNNSEDER